MELMKTVSNNGIIFNNAEEVAKFIHGSLSNKENIVHEDKAIFGTILNTGYLLRDSVKFVTKKGTLLAFSMQASKLTYCSPRETSMEYGFYTAVELGFPSWKLSDETINKYAEDPDKPKKTIYPYLPISVLAEEILIAYNTL